MKGFIVYPTYRIKGNEAFIHLYGRMDNGKTFLAVIKQRPYFFIKKKDQKKAEKVAKKLVFDIEETKLKNFDDEDVIKIVLNNPMNVPGLRDVWHENEINTYEGDIRFVYRYLIDNGLKGSVEIKGKSEDGKDYGVDEVFFDPILSPSDWKPKLKVLSFDIETDKDTGKLFAISLVSDKVKTCLIQKKGKFKNAESFEDEKKLLQRFKELVLEIDPDIIVGWNVIDFDLDFLEKKFKEHHVPFVLGRTQDVCKLRRYESFMRDSTANFPGRQILDGIHLMRISFVKMEDNKLDTAAKVFLGKRKVITSTGIDKYQEIKDAYEKNTQKLIDYNIQDSQLVYDILKKSGVLELTIRRSLITGMQLDRVRASVASLDNLYLAEIRKRGYVAPSSHYTERERRITGGYVRDSKPGIYDYVIVCDFKSLYPSIMRTFNIDPWAYVPEGKKYKGEVITAPNGARFKKETGILPDLLRNLGDRRTQAKKDKNLLESNAVKVLMNSIFGVLANPNCRFYSFEMSNAITLFGQHWIKLTAKKLEKKGYEVIYGDTDSIFVNLKVDNEKEAEKIANEITTEMNEFFTKHIKKKYGVDSYLELEFEKTYKRFLMPKVRASETGAKKRYAGIITKEGKEEIEFVGMEFVRRDWTDLSKKFQYDILKLVFKKKNPSKFITKFVKDLKNGKYDDMLVYKKALRKNIDEYVKTTPPHVKAARKLERVESNIIEYLITVDGPEPLQKISHSIDYDHYIEKQLKPIADQVLNFFNITFEDILKGTKQMKLDGF